MKWLLAIVTTIFVLSGVWGLPPSCEAENKTLKEECENKVKTAADLILKLDTESAFNKIVDPEGSFVGDKSHVFCIDSDNGQLLAHKVKRFVGVNMHNYMDADMQAPYTGILEKAKQDENGWTTYLTYGSGPDKRKTPGLKNMYFLKVPGKSIILCCGYWENS